MKTTYIFKSKAHWFKVKVKVFHLIIDINFELYNKL